MPLETKPTDASDELAADFARLAQKPKKDTEGQGAPVPVNRPSLRGNILKAQPDERSDEHIAAIADQVARGHGGFTGVKDRIPEKLQVERMTLIIPAATGQDLAEKAAKLRVTKTYLLLKALKDAGLTFLRLR